MTHYRFWQKPYLAGFTKNNSVFGHEKMSDSLLLTDSKSLSGSGGMIHSTGTCWSPHQVNSTREVAASWWKSKLRSWVSPDLDMPTWCSHCSWLISNDTRTVYPFPLKFIAHQTVSILDSLENHVQSWKANASFSTVNSCQGPPL